MIRNLTSSEVVFTVSAELDDLDPRECFDGDNDGLAMWVLRQLDKGNMAAWMHVSVSAKWNGLEGVASLSGVSYESMEDFNMSDELNDLRAEALDKLNESVRELAEAMKLLGVSLDM